MSHSAPIPRPAVPLLRRAGLAVLLGATLFAAGCATTGNVRVHTDYDRATSFERYRTFGFAQPLGADEQGYTTLVSQRLKSAARHELEARGYTYAETAPDLLVNFGARLEDKTRVTSMPEPSFGVGYGYRRYGTWIGYHDQVDVREYEQGTLTVDLVDAARHQLVWSGTIVGEVTKQHRANLDAAVSGAVARVFAKYPFRAGEGASAPGH